MRPDRFLYKAIHWTYRRFRRSFDQVYTRWLFSIHQVDLGPGLDCRGIPDIYISRGGKMNVGSGLILNNGRYHNMAGREQNCLFAVYGGELSIGNNVGMSSVAIVCTDRIVIGDNVRIGGSACIYDSDFHSLDPVERAALPEIVDHVQTKPVILENDCFIGNHVTILKGVRIGARSVVGSSSLVARSIPPDEIWAGNPARFIRKIDDAFLTQLKKNQARALAEL